MTGIPFMSDIGNMVDRLIGLHLAQYRICLTNSVVCPPYSNKTHKFLITPGSEHIEACNPRLVEFTNMVFTDPKGTRNKTERPKVILALGNPAKRAATMMKKHIDDLVIFECVHPGSVLRQGEQGALDYSRCTLKFAEVATWLKKQRRAAR